MYILSIIIGVLTVFAFTPYNIVFFIIVGFSSIFYLILKAKNIQDAFFIGFLFGLGYFGFGNWWLFSIPDNTVATILFGSGIIILMSFFYAFASAISNGISKLEKSYFLIFTPIIWTVVEELRHSLWGGFSWLNPSDSLAYPIFRGLFATFGSLGVDFLIFAISTYLAYYIFFGIKKFVIYTFSGTIFISFLLYLLNSITYTNPTQKTIKTVLFQDEFDNDAKESAYRVIKRVESYYHMFVNSDAKLAIMPESTVSVEQYEISGELKRLFKNLKDKEIIYGAYTQKGGKTYNSIVLASSLRQVYAKTHLIPFGEYMPNWAKSLHKYLPYFNMSDISPFFNNKNFEINGISFGASICYEHLFDSELRENFAKANVLLNLSDLGWFNSSWVAPYMVSLAQIRAMEFGKPFIYSVNGGYSAYILPNGKIDKIGLKKGRYMLSVILQPYTGETLYAKYGYISLAAITVLWVLIISILIRREK